MTRIGYHSASVTTTSDYGKGAALRDRTKDGAGRGLIYAQAGEAIAQYDAVAIDEDGQAMKLTKALADAGHTIAIAQVGLADNEYAWFLTDGVGEVNVLISCAPDVALYTSGTAGKLDDTSSSQTKVVGIKITSLATAAGNKEFIATELHVG